MDLNSQKSIPVTKKTIISDQDIIQEAGFALRTLAHFSKNILQMVGGAAEVTDLCIERKDLQRLDKGWAVFLPNLERLKRLMLDLCEYSKNRPLALETCNVNRLVQNSIQQLPAAALESAPDIHVNTQDQINSITLDPLKIKQLVQHILIHIIDILRSSDVRIQIDIRCLPQQEEIMIGISANLECSDLNEIRDWFQPQEFKNCRFRTGLDLPLARRLAEYHNGRIEAEINPDGETAFLVFLPSNLS